MVKIGEKNEKNTISSCVFSLAATSLSAGSMATPEMEEPVVSASSSTGTPMLILLALLIAVGVSAK